MKSMMPLLVSKMFCNDDASYEKLNKIGLLLLNLTNAFYLRFFQRYSKYNDHGFIVLTRKEFFVAPL